MDWRGVRLWGGGDVAEVRARLAAGTDPLAPAGPTGPPMLHAAAEWGSPEVVAALAGAARELDGLFEGRSALWRAVFAGRHEVAGALAAAGADPWLPMMAGWSPGRLGLAGPVPDLFGVPPAGVALTAAEASVAARAREVGPVLAGIHLEGTGLLCVAGIDAAEAIRRLGGTPTTVEELLDHYGVEVDEDEDDFDPAGEDGWQWLHDEYDPLLVGVSDVPGGCVVTQPWGFQPQTSEVGTRLSAGTTAYGFFANPKSGDQGSLFIDGRHVAGDLTPGGSPGAGDPGDEVLRCYVHHQSNAAAYACGRVGLRPADARAVTGPADVWVLLPEAVYG